MTQAMLNPVQWSDIRRDMTPAERFFACCLARGEPCRLGSSTPKIGNGKNSIRGEVIRFFACGGDESHPVLGPRITLQGAWISEILDLSAMSVHYALLFHRCHFGSRFIVERAECRVISMDGSHLAKGLDGDGLRVRGGVFMRGGFSVNGKVRLIGASIGGDLDCRESEFHNPGKDAILANNAKIGGRVFMHGGFSARGEVCMLGASIGGDLNCRGGKFHNPGKNALRIDRATIGGEAHTSNGFSAEGGVSMLGASVGGNLDCCGGKFHNPDEGDSGENVQGKYALNAERVKTGGHVYLNKHTAEVPFTAHGRVRFANADIGGNFNCKGGKFLHLGERSAIAAGGLKSRGAVFLSEGFFVDGDVDLHVAHIGNFVCKKCDANSKGVINLSSTKAAAVDDDRKSWEQFQFRLDGFTYDTFFGEDTPKDKSRREWLSKRDGPFSPLPYEQAAKVLFDMGRGSDARKILLKKERLQTKDKQMPWQHKFGRFLWDAFAGYGYRLRRTLYWMLGVVFFGALVFNCVDEDGWMVPHQPVVLTDEAYKAATMPVCAEFKCIPKRRPTEVVKCLFPGYPEFNAFFYSVDVFIPFFALHQEPYWYPSGGDYGILPPLRLLWYWLEIGFGWILTSLFLLSVTGVLRPRQSSGEKS